MLPQPTVCQKLNVNKAKMSPKLRCHQTWYVIKTKNVNATKMSLKMKYHQKLNVINTEMLLNWNVIKTEKSPKLICY